MELAIALTVILILAVVFAIRVNDNSLSFPFKKKHTLFTQVERSFLTLLEQAVGHEYRILCRVRLTDVIAVKQSTDKKTARNALSRANGRHLDFVLCDKNDMLPVAAIDLVHQQGSGYKSQRDWFVSGALDAARVPHLRIKVKSGYQAKDIRTAIDARLAPLKAQASSEQPLVKGTLNSDQPRPPTRPLRSSRAAA